MTKQAVYIKVAAPNQKIPDKKKFAMKTHNTFRIGKKAQATMSDIIWVIVFLIVLIVFFAFSKVQSDNAQDDLTKGYRVMDGNLALMGWLRWPIAPNFPGEAKDGYLCLKDQPEVCPFKEDATMADLLGFYFYAKQAKKENLDINLKPLKQQIKNACKPLLARQEHSDVIRGAGLYLELEDDKIVVQARRLALVNGKFQKYLFSDLGAQVFKSTYYIPTPEGFVVPVTIEEWTH